MLLIRSPNGFGFANCRQCTGHTNAAAASVTLTQPIASPKGFNEAE
jgi:hypothetical protein